MIIRYLVVFTAFLYLSACDSGPNFATLCKENPEICEEFTEDSWCKRERIAVGVANVEAKLSPNNDLPKFNQLIAYEGYEKCISHAAKIEHIKLKEKKTRRINNMILARARIEELTQSTKSSEHPRLLYYHWTRELDEQALEKFLALEGTKALETSESQYELATYYIKRDPTKTLQLLFRSLELLEDSTDINDEVFKSLSSIFAKKNKAKQAYIWLKVLSLYDPEDPVLNHNALENYIATHDLDYEFLDQVAEATLNKIESLQFIAPKF
ncbi:DUF2989 domain-containing protein [Thalassotalea hakodatensis]|uniref:DUF2989 domain-containing protein n=1 Tax=Thalassotalea hakodatensis TaxID=3030492 RepID=UPI0025731B51|nr:DUF2989 domain-containing protein [Thalassotalea hakodatensis]